MSMMVRGPTTKTEYLVQTKYETTPAVSFGLFVYGVALLFHSIDLYNTNKALTALKAELNKPAVVAAATVEAASK